MFDGKKFPQKVSISKFIKTIEKLISEITPIIMPWI